VAVSSDGSKVYIANQSSGTISIIDAATNTVTATISVGGISADPNGVAITPDGRKVFVAIPAFNTVAVIATGTNTVTMIAVGIEPIDVAVNPDGSKVYASNRSSDTCHSSIRPLIG
jgi:YVTN family beta-propeller protein